MRKPSPTKAFDAFVQERYGYNVEGIPVGKIWEHLDEFATVEPQLAQAYRDQQYDWVMLSQWQSIVIGIVLLLIILGLAAWLLPFG